MSRKHSEIIADLLAELPDLEGYSLEESKGLALDLAYALRKAEESRALWQKSAEVLCDLINDLRDLIARA